MKQGQRKLNVSKESVSDEGTGTSIDLTLHQNEDIKRLFASPKATKRALFNSFAAYLARYPEVILSVNDEAVSLSEFVDEQETEEIAAAGDVPSATLLHLVLGTHVEQMAPNLLVFATKGTTVSTQVLDDDVLLGRKYLGFVDSPYLSEITSTNKTELAEFDAGFRSLRDMVMTRARRFISARQGSQSKAFLERARTQVYYPYPDPPRTPVDRYRRQLYDGLLLTMEEQYRIGSASAKQQELIFALTKQLMQSEDLASVLTGVLGLKGDDVAKFASLLRRTSLSSIIAIADLLVDRMRFLDELQVLVYGFPARYVKERKQLHKIIEGHTWLFGEQYHLMTSDRSVAKLLDSFRSSSDPDDELIDIDEALRDIPDLYLSQSKWNEGARYHQHLIVELKRPSVRVSRTNVHQLEKYSEAIVDNPVWGQRSESHRFTFVIVSSDVSKSVVKAYQEDEEPGLLSRPKLPHPTELWALRWSDFLDRRREELKFLEKEIEVTADPELLEYLKERVGDLLPAEATRGAQAAS